MNRGPWSLSYLRSYGNWFHLVKTSQKYRMIIKWNWFQMGSYQFMYDFRHTYKFPESFPWSWNCLSGHKCYKPPVLCTFRYVPLETGWTALPSDMMFIPNLNIHCLLMFYTLNKQSTAYFNAAADIFRARIYVTHMVSLDGLYNASQHNTVLQKQYDDKGNHSSVKKKTYLAHHILLSRVGYGTDIISSAFCKTTRSWSYHQNSVPFHNCHTHRR